MSDESNVKNKVTVLSIFKNMFFWLIPLLFLEISFRICLNYSFDIEAFVNIFIYSSLVSAILSIITMSFPKKYINAIVLIILFILGFLFSFQCIFYNIFKTYFSFANLALADQVYGFIENTFILIGANILYALLFFIPFIVFIFIKKKLNLQRNTKWNNCIYLLIIILTISLFYLHLFITSNNNGNSYELYYNVDIVSSNNEKFGVLNSYRIDLIRTLFGFEQKLEKEHSLEIPKETDSSSDKKEEIVYEYNKTSLDFEKATTNNNIKSINEYMKNELPTQKNEYTGKFKDYNLVYITAESFYDLAISEELTPTLYKLTHSGFIFDNFYSPTVLSTIGGEFQSLTGLYPNIDILSKWRSGTNYFPYGLGTVFREAGYNTYAYHDHTYTFQDRNKYLLSQGFTNYVGVRNGLEKKINTKLWPESDDEMIEATASDYINSEAPFMTYYMTVSGHMNYNFNGGNSMSLKNRDAVKNLKASEEIKAYIATQIELDKALERLINKLEEAGKLDNTVFVILADHYPYALSTDSINSYSSYKRDGVVEICHNALIIWNSKMEDTHIEKTCMSCDVLPTVLNLFGIEYDSRILTGNDILSNTPGLAIMSNLSWVSDKGTYFAGSKKFVPKNDEVEISDNYIENMNNIVKNRLNIAKLIIKSNYYNYLFK